MAERVKGLTRHQRIQQSNKHGKHKVLLDTGHTVKRNTHERKTKMTKRRISQTTEILALVNAEWWKNGSKYIPAGPHANTRHELMDNKALALEGRPTLDEVIEEWGM